MGMFPSLPKEVTDTLKQTQSMADDLKEIRGLLQRLIELEEKK